MEINLVFSDLPVVFPDVRVVPCHFLALPRRTGCIAFALVLVKFMTIFVAFTNILLFFALVLPDVPCVLGNIFFIRADIFRVLSYLAVGGMSHRQHGHGEYGTQSDKCRLDI